ncbi:MAG: hypothetical protein KGI38_03565 [Thaumarchaeota archaeon]|nr:hypothetical protein [Nitrososphaerota archaeon]
MKQELASANPGALVLAARAGSVRNEFLVEMLAAQTFQAMSSGSLLANKPEIDLLLRLAGTTQISRAIEDHGTRPGERSLLVVAGRKTVEGPKQLAELELPRRRMTRPELMKVERAALLNAQRP